MSVVCAVAGERYERSVWSDQGGQVVGESRWRLGIRVEEKRWFDEFEFHCG
jgi:hypothetical protein